MLTPDLARLINERNQHTLFSTLGMYLLPGEGDVLCAEMKCTERNCQPFGCLNGGANLAMAETVTGMGSLLLAGPDEGVVGMQVSGNHLKTVQMGETVRAECRILHRGRSTHVWDVNIYNGVRQLVCTVRVCNYIVKLKDGEVNDFSQRKRPAAEHDRAEK